MSDESEFYLPVSFVRDLILQVGKETSVATVPRHSPVAMASALVDRLDAVDDVLERFEKKIPDERILVSQ